MDDARYELRLVIIDHDTGRWDFAKCDITTEEMDLEPQELVERFAMPAFLAALSRCPARPQ